jgi:hypothetical protein
MSELAEARAEAEQFHARLADDGFVAHAREQVEAWRGIEAERDRARAVLAQVDAALTDAGIECRSPADGIADLAAMSAGRLEEVAAAAHTWADALRNRDQGTCGCGCDCANWLNQQADKIEEDNRG